MSQGQPPAEGPAPYTERDLDDLLSGTAANVPEALRRVATALDALRGGPAPGELDGEAAARAAFRMFASAAPADPAWDELAKRPAAWYDSAREAMTAARRPLADTAWDLVAQPAQAGDVRGQELARLAPPARPAARAAAGAGARLITMPGRSAGKRPRRVPRHRAPRRAGWRALTAAGTGAVALIVGVAALAGAFSGSGGQGGQAENSASANPSASASGSPRPQVLGEGASKEPITNPTPSANGAHSAGSSSSAGAERNELCRQYFEFFIHPFAPGSRSSEDAIFKELSELAGSPAGIFGYCAGAQSQGDPGTSANVGTGANAGTGANVNTGAGDGGIGNNDNDGPGGQQRDQQQNQSERNPSEQSGPTGHGSVGSIGSGLTGNSAHAGNSVGGSAAGQLRSVQPGQLRSVQTTP